MKTDFDPENFDDPNVTIESILESVQTLSESPLNIVPAKLKQGYGSEVIYILNRLADEAISKNYTPSPTMNIRYSQSTKPDENANEDENMEEIADQEDDSDLVFDEFPRETLLVEDDQYTDYEDGFEEDDFFHDNLLSSRQYNHLDRSRNDSNRMSNVAIDTSQWQLEVEKVTPQLKVILKSAAQKSDWRNNLVQIQNYHSEMSERFELINSDLGKLRENLFKVMEKIGAREKYLQIQLETLINEYISLKNNLNQVTENHNRVSGGVMEKSRQLATISEEMESVKEQMEERGNSMTDGSPLINLRKSVQKLRQEVVTIDVRIGVAMHTLFKIRLSELSQRDFSKRSSSISAVF